MTQGPRPILVIAGLAFAAVLVLSLWLPELEPGLSQRVTASAILELLLLALVLVFVCASRRPSASLLGWQPGRLPGSVLAALVVATLAASHALDAALSLSDLRQGSALEELAQALRGAAGLELGFALVAIGLLPALAEELLFRGLVQRELARRFGVALAIAVSSLSFALVHGEPVHALLAAPLGLHLGLVAWWADSTRPAVLCHAANNVGAVLLAAAAFEFPGTPGLHAGLGVAVAAASWTVALALGPATGGAPPGGGDTSPLQPDPELDDG